MTPSLSSQATMIRRDRPRKLFCCTWTMCAIMLSCVVLFPQSASTASSPPKQVLFASQRLHCVLILHVVSRCITAFYSLALTFTSVAPPPSILPPPTLYCHPQLLYCQPQPRPLLHLDGGGYDALSPALYSA